MVYIYLALSLTWVCNLSFHCLTTFKNRLLLFPMPTVFFMVYYKHWQVCIYRKLVSQHMLDPDHGIICTTHVSLHLEDTDLINNKHTVYQIKGILKHF